MSTYDYMNDAEYEAVVDAGRGPAPDPRDTADRLRKERQERSEEVNMSEVTGVVLDYGDGWTYVVTSEPDPRRDKVLIRLGTLMRDGVPVAWDVTQREARRIQREEK